MYLLTNIFLGAITMCNSNLWELIYDDEHGRRTLRMEVHGGWLYAYELTVPTSNDFCGASVAMQFVPNPYILKPNTTPTRPKVKVRFATKSPAK
jgi:hypothetical protein